MSLTCFVLAAGKGARMHSDLPKPLHPVAGRPMVSWCMSAAQALVPDRIVVVIGTGMEALAEQVAPCQTALQAQPKGTGHAVRCALEAAGPLAGDVLVLYGDTPLITAGTLRKLLDRRKAGDNPAVVVSGMIPPQPTGYGRLLVEGGSLLGIIEEKEAADAQRSIRLCNGGILLFDGAELPRLLAGLSDNNVRGEFYLTDTVALARRAGRVCAHVEIPYEEVMGVNSRTELAAVEAVMQQRLRQAAMEGGATLVDPASVHLSWDTRLGRDVMVSPYVVFGPGVTVAEGATIGPFCHLREVSIAPGAVIAPFSDEQPPRRAVRRKQV